MTLTLTVCAGLLLGAGLGAGVGVGARAADAQTLDQHRAATAVFTVRGTVADHDGHAIADAEIALIEHDSATRLVRSDTSGRFSMSELASPTLTLRVRRLGFQPRIVAVNLARDNGNRPLLIELEVMPAELAGMTTTDASSENDARLRDYLTRKASNSFGKYIDGDEIQKRHLQYLSEVFRGVSGATVNVSNHIGNTVRIRGCAPLVWLDGVRIPGAQVDEVAQPSEVAAMEIYNSFAGIPAQYFDRSATCGTVLLWSRAR